MMDEHISEKDFRKYGGSQLVRREFLRAQAHLEICEDCRRRLGEMFPNIAEAEKALLIEDLRKETVADFHLNYEEHLKPFIYETIGAVEREMVESHIEVCARCREDLRDLIQFHEELEREKEIRQLSKTSWWTQLTDWFSHPNRRTLWLAFAAVLIFVSAGLIWLLVSRSSDEIVQNPVNSTDLPNKQTVPVVDSNQILIKKDQNSDLTKTNETNNQNAAVPEKEPESANLVLSKVLKKLEPEKDLPLRGEGDLPTQKIAVISPNGKVIRDSSPVLQWQNVPNVQTYQIIVFDENNNRITIFDAVSGNSQWIADLPKGKIYKWQVSAKTGSADEKTTNFIGKGKFYIISRAEENRINQAKDRLEKGRTLAEAGLLSEAAKEFRRYLKKNPKSETAKKWLNQVLQKNKVQKKTRASVNLI